LRTEDLQRLYAAYAGPLYGFLAYRTGDTAAAEDLLADTFERALKARRRFDPRRGSERAWLYAIALNLSRNHARTKAAERRAVERLTPDLAAPADTVADEVADRDELHTALDRLSEEEREALALRFGLELSLSEIAKLTGDPMTTVEGRVYRGLRKLRELLGRPGE
jgi:RNA polymerase sigma-70 factor, ECF subfamily